MLNLFYYKRFQLERSNIILKLSSRLSTYDHVIKIPKTKVESAHKHRLMFTLPQYCEDFFILSAKQVLYAVI